MDQDRFFAEMVAEAIGYLVPNQHAIVVDWESGKYAVSNFDGEVTIDSCPDIASGTRIKLFENEADAVVAAALDPKGVYVSSPGMLSENKRAIYDSEALDIMGQALGYLIKQDEGILIRRNEKDHLIYRQDDSFVMKGMEDTSFKSGTIVKVSRDTDGIVLKVLKEPKDDIDRLLEGYPPGEPF